MTDRSARTSIRLEKLFAVLAASVVILSACSGADNTGETATGPSQTTGQSSNESSSSTTTGTSTTVGSLSSSTTATTVSTTSTTATPASGCGAGPSSVPTGAVSREVIDVDGDGIPDVAWLEQDASGAVTAGVITSSGGGTERTWDSASPVTRSLLVVSVNDTTPPLFLADDGRAVQLWAFDDCVIKDVTNVQGAPYTFSLGLTDIGTGVGCSTVDGRQELVGLDGKTSDNGTTVNWSSTVVTVSGTQARNGTVRTGTYTSPDDDPAIDLLHEVTCGNAGIDSAGITLNA